MWQNIVLPNYVEEHLYIVCLASAAEGTNKFLWCWRTSSILPSLASCWGVACLIHYWSDCTVTSHRRTQVQHNWTIRAQHIWAGSKVNCSIGTLAKSCNRLQAGSILDMLIWEHTSAFVDRNRLSGNVIHSKQKKQAEHSLLVSNKRQVGSPKKQTVYQKQTGNSWEQASNAGQDQVFQACKQENIAW